MPPRNSLFQIPLSIPPALALHVWGEGHAPTVKDLTRFYSEDLTRFYAEGSDVKWRGATRGPPSPATKDAAHPARADTPGVCLSCLSLPYGERCTMHLMAAVMGCSSPLNPVKQQLCPVACCSCSSRLLLTCFTCRVFVSHVADSNCWLFRRDVCSCCDG